MLVDEVLAVGDVAFQKECLGKMDDVARSGRTVLSVSHNMTAVLNLCDTGILLHNGRVSYSGKASDVVSRYLATLDQHTANSLRDHVDRTGSGLVRVVECKTSRAPGGEPVTDLMLGDAAYVTLTVEALEATRVFVGIQVRDAWGRLVFAFNSREAGYAPHIEQGETDIVLYIPHLPFLAGKYIMDATVHSMDRRPHDKIEKVNSFKMHPKDLYGSGVPFNSKHAVAFIEHEWVGCNDT